MHEASCLLTTMLTVKVVTLMILNVLEQPARRLNIIFKFFNTSRSASNFTKTNTCRLIIMMCDVFFQINSGGLEAAESGSGAHSGAAPRSNRVK